jgi:polyisoprenoid-binding protein YceI
MKRLLASACLFATLAAVLAPSAVAQTIVKQGSEISFTSRQLGVPVDGRFAQWDAQIRFDPKAPAAGEVSFSIATGSATFGSTETETEVRQPVWFNVAAFPQAKFASTAIAAAGPGRFDVSGRLTIKGQTRDIVVPVTLAGNVASGSFTIQRLAFDIGSGEWADTSMVANDVKVQFKLQLEGLKP